MKKNDVMLFHKDVKIDKSLIEKQAYKWIYFGTNFSYLLEWEKKLDKNKYLKYEKLLHDLSYKLRIPFIEWIAELGKPYGDSLSWWISNIAEKNTFTSNLFLYLTYIEVLKEILKQDIGCLFIIICENTALLITLKEVLIKSDNIIFKRSVDWLTLINKDAKNILYFLGRWLKGFYTIFCIHLVLYFIPKTKPNKSLKSIDDKPLILFHWQINQKSINPKDSTLNNAFFPILPQWLESKGFNIKRLIWFWDIDIKTLKFIRKYSQKFIIPQDYLKIYDYIYPFMMVLSTLNVPKKYINFNGTNVSALLRKEQILQAQLLDKVSFLIYLPMMKRLKELGFNFDFVIDKFENMAMEKPLIYACKKYYPDAAIVGYVHPTISPLMLKYSTTSEEFNRGLFPDIIISNGPFFRKILIDNGFPQQKIKIGPALRFAHLWSKENYIPLSDKNFLVILLSLDPPTSGELLTTAIDWLNNTPYKILIKPHPFMKKDYLLNKFMGGISLKNIQWTNETIDKCLQKAFCVVGTAGASLMDALGVGVPAIVISRQTAFNINPLGWLEKELDGAMYTVYNKDSFLEVLKELALKTDAVAKRMEKIRHKIVECFTPINDDTLQVFIPQKR
ncbi:MAG: hypothetical protein HQK87_11860, partial [Nitrospinae bacterium]|nr:hypothetical protein [Nitrospinota bacterium]